MSEGEIETVGIGFYFEDLPVGRKFKTVGRTVTEPDIVGFINTIGMTEVLFMNIEFLKHESDIKGRVSPGSLVFCLAEGLLSQATMQRTGFPFLHMELDIKRPLFTNDTIHEDCEFIASRPSKSTPNPGLL